MPGGREAETPRSTVVIPCRDDGETLPAALASIREDEPVEIVVVDDGSSDAGTSRALEQAERGGARVLAERPLGVAAARNAGLAATVTPFVFFLDADDLLEPGALGRLADELERDPAAGFAHGAVRYLGDANYVRPAYPWDPWVLLHTNLWPVSALFRTETVRSAGGFTPGAPYEDWDLFLTLAERGERGLAVATLAFSYRVRAERRNRSSQRSFAAAYRALAARHPDLFARRAELARRSPLPRWKRALYRAQLAGGLHAPWAVSAALMDAKLRFRRPRVI